MKRYLKEYTFIALGSVSMAAGMTMFLVPFQLSSGSLGTLATILLYLFKIPLSVTNLVCNIVLFVLGFKLLGKDVILKTIAGILLFSLSLEVATYLPVFKDDIFLAMVMGGVLDGIGMGLVLRVNASTGGIDLVALMVKKFIPHISMATFIFAVNCIVFTISGFIFKSYLVTFYSIIAMYVSSKITDSVMSMGEQAKSVYIISNHSAEIEKNIMDEFKRGVTEFYTRGAFSQEERKTLLCVVKPKEAPKIISSVKKIDRKAFVIVSDAKEVIGEGFKLSQ